MNNIQRKSTSSIKLKSLYFNIDKVKTNPLQVERRYSNNLKNIQLFHLPIINFTNENENNSNLERYRRKSLMNSANENFHNKIFNRENNEQKQINNYNVNFNLNIHNSYSSSNVRLNDFSKNQKTNKGKIGNILQNLKGLSEKLKNPTNFFRNYGTNNISSFKPFNKSDDNLRKYSFINNSKMKQNMIINMNKQIEKIDFIYEKIIVSLLEKYIKKNKPYK
jgi:hypothetical protein